MSRYIDAELIPALFDEEYKETRELIYQGETHLDNLAEGFSEAAHVIRKMPTADVVEVVRCKDCIYYKANSCFNRQWDFESSTEIPMVRDCDFCSYGEMRDDGK